MSEKSTIRVPAERMTQIRQIVAARGLSGVNDLIAHWINREITEGTIPAGVPGVNIVINTADHAGELTLGELMLNPTREEAKELSRAIREIAAGHQKAIETKIAKVRAAGAGFAIEGLNTTGRYVGGANLLTDVADQIDASIK